MPRIRFTGNAKPPFTFRTGDEADLSDDQANRWLRRGIGVIVPPAPPAEPAPKPPVVVDGFNPETAPIEDVRAFLAERGHKIHHRSSEKKLREAALELLTA
jgi:hypothetical protein